MKNGFQGRFLKGQKGADNNGSVVFQRYHECGLAQGQLGRSAKDFMFCPD